MSQGRAETPRPQPADRETDYISCILPEGTAGNSLGVSEAQWRGGRWVQRDVRLGAESGAEGSRAVLGVYGPGGVWKGRRNESSGVTAWLGGGGIRARGGLEGAENVRRR